MKKALCLLLAIGLFTGCSCTANMGNTPTKKVEEYLNKYQTNDDVVVSDLNDVLTNDVTLTDDERVSYSDFMKTHYQDMQYEIKDETIDGDSATVTAEVTVRNYADAINEANNYRLYNVDEFTDTNTFANYRLDRLKEVTNTETYTITFYLNKEDDEWKIENLTDDDLRKLSGMYGVTDVNSIDTDNTDTTNDNNDDNNDGIIGDMIEDATDNNTTDDNTDNNTTDDNNTNNNQTTTNP